MATKKKASMAKRVSTAPIKIVTFPAGRPSPEHERLLRDVMFESNRLYNRLVEVERDRFATYCRIRCKHSAALDAAEREVESAEEACETLFRLIQETKAKQYRSTGEKSDALPDELREADEAAKERVKTAREAHKLIRTEVEESIRPTREAFMERVKARATEIDPDAEKPHSSVSIRAKEEVFEEMCTESETPALWVDLYKCEAAAVESGKRHREAAVLTGGCSDDVFERFRSAKQKRAKEMGLPPKFRAFAGDGKLPAKLTKKGGRDTTWSDLWDASKLLALTLCPSPPRERTGKSRRPEFRPRTSQRLRVPEERRYAVASFFVRVPKTGEKTRVEIPIKLTQDLPHDAAIKRAWVRVRECAGRISYVVQFVVEHESFAAQKRPSGVGTVALHFGWRQAQDGGIRCATWLGSDGEIGEIVMPAKMATMIDHPDIVQHYRGLARSQVCRFVESVSRLSGSRLSNAERDTRRDTRQIILRHECEAYAKHVLGESRLYELWATWKRVRFASDGPRSLGATLPTAMRWARRNGMAGTQERLAWALWVWARQDRHLLDFERFERKAGTNRRTYWMRHEAIRLATRYDVLVTDDTRYKDLAQRKRGTEADEDMPDRVRKNRKIASPGESRSTFRDVFGKLRSVVVSAKDQTAKCATCGAVMLGEKGAMALRCPEHGVRDVERNACETGLARAKQKGEKEPGGVGDDVAAE